MKWRQNSIKKCWISCRELICVALAGISDLIGGSSWVNSSFSVLKELKVLKISCLKFTCYTDMQKII